MKRLHELGTRIITGTRVRRFAGRTAYVDSTNGEERLDEFDTVVSATGASPANELLQALTARGLDVHVIGDAKKPRNIVEAVAEGFETGRSL